MNKVFYKPLFLMICFVLSLSSFSQNVSLLRKSLDTVSNDSIYTDISLKLAYDYLDFDLDSAIFFINKAENLSLAQKNQPFLAQSLFYKGVYLDFSGEYIKAIDYYNQSLVIFEKLDDKVGIAKCYRNIGDCYSYIYQEDQALIYYSKSLENYTLLNDKEGLANIYINIGHLFYNEENYSFANKYFNDALELYIETEDKEGIASCYTNIANATSDSGNYELGLELYLKSIDIQLELDDKYGIGINYNNIGDNFLQLNEYNQAREYFDKALSIAEEINQNDLYSIVYLNLALLSEKQKRYREAINYAKKSIDKAETIGSLEYELENLKVMSISNEKIGNTTAALDYLKKYEKVKDSFMSIDKRKKVKLFEALNEIENNQYTIKELAAKNEISELRHENEKKFIYFLIIISVIFGFFVVILINQQTSKKRAYALLEHKNHLISNMNDEIKDQSDNLQKINDTKDKFFSIIAHDLKNPFTSIQGFTELLIENYEEYDDAKKIKFLKVIKSSTNTAVSLLDNLLVWASTQTGNIKYKPENLNLFYLINDVLSLLEVQALNKDISIECKIDEHIQVLADENMLNTIFRNLISNAIKFSNEGGKIEIDAESVNGFIKIWVKDNGIGISKENSESIFDITTKTSTYGTAKEKGLGLGLILCKDFVEKHKGSIWVESEIDRGSKFIFTIPRG